MTVVDHAASTSRESGTPILVAENVTCDLGA